MFHSETSTTPSGIKTSVNGVISQESSKFSDFYRRSISAFVMLSIFTFFVTSPPYLCALFIVGLSIAINFEVTPLKLRNNLNRKARLIYYTTAVTIHLLLLLIYIGTIQPFYIPGYITKILPMTVFLTAILLVFILNQCYSSIGHLNLFYKSLAYFVCFSLFSVLSAVLIISNIYNGMYWFIIQVMLIVFSEWGGYFGGRAFGKTLISFLSPKKTYEGYFMGLILSPLVGFIVRII